MTRTLKTFAAASLMAVVAAFTASEANAACSSGFLANLACETGIIDKQTANGMDRWHAQQGRPIETRILPGFADTLYPGSGQVLRQYDRMNRNGSFRNLQVPNFHPGFFPSAMPTRPVFRAPAPVYGIPRWR